MYCEVDLPNLESIEMNQWALQGYTNEEQACSLVMRGWRLGEY